MSASRSSPAKTASPSTSNSIRLLRHDGQVTSPTISKSSSGKKERRRRQQQQQQLPIEPKTVYLIRHGQSLGQAAPNKQTRMQDPSLLDCGLSLQGQDEARAIPHLLGPQAFESIELVVTSPLTRAVHTALLAFATKPLFCHYDLREVGSTSIPENIPRRMSAVFKDLCVDRSLVNIDVETLQPEQWPCRHDTPPKVVRRDRIRNVFSDWLAQRPEKVVAVVAHYNVIRSALDDPWDCRTVDVRPENATPILCELDANAILRIIPNNLEEEE